MVESQSLVGASTARPETATQLDNTSGPKKGFISFLDEVIRRDTDARFTKNVTPHKVICTQACCAVRRTSMHCQHQTSAHSNEACRIQPKVMTLWSQAEVRATLTPTSARGMQNKTEQHQSLIILLTSWLVRRPFRRLIKKISGHLGGGQKRGGGVSRLGQSRFSTYFCSARF